MSEQIIPTYYMVHDPERGMPKKSHATMAEAATEARRLAAANNSPAYVLKAVAVAKPVEPKTVLVTCDDVP